MTNKATYFVWGMNLSKWEGFNASGVTLTTAMQDHEIAKAIEDQASTLFPNQAIHVECYTDEIHVYRADDEECEDPIAGMHL